MASLKLCLDSSELSAAGGHQPIRACGVRFVCHKVAAIGQVIDRYGAYMAHLIGLTDDSSVKSVDRQKLKGYVKRWSDAKLLIGCSLFNDILTSAVFLCKALQEDELCIVSAVEAIVKATKSIEKVRTAAFEDLPTVKRVLARVYIEKNGTHTYHGVEVCASCRISKGA